MKKMIKIIIILLVLILLVTLIKIVTNNLKDKNAGFVQVEEKYNGKKTRSEYNEFKFIDISTEKLLGIYFNKYINTIFENISNAYDMLDEEYREIRFGSLDNYKNYVYDNIEMIDKIEITSYKELESDGNIKQYVCIDENNNYYIIKEEAVMKFTIMLDTYTIETQEFYNQYEMASDEEKCALNLQKFFQAMNVKDYNYAYDCMAQSFKNNYFTTQELFKIYMEANFFDVCDVEYEEFIKKSGLFLIKMNIRDYETMTDNFEKTFVMQLNDGTDFELSFDI